jgi:AraC-like DNA-binding protein
MAASMKDEMMYIVTHKEASPFHLIGHLYLFLDDFIRSMKTEFDRKKNDFIDYYIGEAITFVEQNFQNDITVEDIAAFCGLNRSYFGKIFRDRTGSTPQEFLISYRMSRATELLKLTELSVADIGNAVGYANQLHFSRAFKKIYGVSPRQWRNENRITS